MENKTFEERKKIIYEFISDPHYVPMKQKELAVILQVAKEDREELGRVLEALLGEGKIELSKRGRYSKAQPRKAVGTFTSHARGFGFVSVEGQEQDILIRTDGSKLILTTRRNQRVVIADVSGAVLFNGSVCGTREFSLQRGFYIVNGKKIMIAQ